MIVAGVLVVELMFPEAMDPRERAGRLARLKSLVRNRCKLSAAEVNPEEGQGTVSLAVAAVSSREDLCGDILEEALNVIEGANLLIVLDHQAEMIEL